MQYLKTENTEGSSGHWSEHRFSFYITRDNDINDTVRIKSRFTIDL